ncbi:hypothetical protein [Natranaeroarchaeum aerophilus]|uniref:Uncharacterized protein n=1 Tax=Natranaeroarchaeum aerophilus TaxID=2917711 RepID=A0AAE3FSN9_9EURY|nr:hypothetical protein [Natranaeroarchaeum aerophilus]MCL9814847.1 hypothetical protein [Natranaeroarchaeum aerophilus]
MDPDIETDLGYEPAELDVVTVDRLNRDQRLFLPTDEDALHEDAFIVADADAVCDLVDHI